MKILHTSDWHIGRTFHTRSTLEAVEAVLGAIAAVVRDRSVDVVAVAGDVFDSSTPSADAIRVLETAFRTIRAAGAEIVLTSGNHDSSTRLGMHAEWLAPAGIHKATRPDHLAEPVTIPDAAGPVHFYGIPYLEPALLRHAHPEADLRTHEQTLTWAMDLVRADAAARGGRAVVLAHCFVADVTVRSESSDVERDITAGGLDLVPSSVFAGVDYVALGHIHGRSTIAPGIRYSGAPLHYSFAEAGKPRGGWLVDLAPTGLAAVEWVDLPVPRPLAQLTGTIDELLGRAAGSEHAESWVKAVVTDRVRPIDGMHRLQAAYPYCVAFEWQPAERQMHDESTYAARVQGRTDAEVVAGFLDLVRNGVGPSEFEQSLVAGLLTERRVKQVEA